MVFCCIVAWIQPDISGCQQDFLEQFLRISRGWQPLENCSRIYPKMSSTNFIFKQQKIEFLNQVWSCYYATGCFVAFLDDISSWGPLLVWVQFSLDYRTHAIITRGLYTFYHWLWTPREDSLPCTAEKFNPNSKFLGTAKAYFVCHIGQFFQILLLYDFIGCPQTRFISEKNDRTFLFQGCQCQFLVSNKRPGLDVWENSLLNDPYYLIFFSNSRTLEWPGLLTETHAS